MAPLDVPAASRRCHRSLPRARIEAVDDARLGAGHQHLSAAAERHEHRRAGEVEVGAEPARAVTDRLTAAQHDPGVVLEHLVRPQALAIGESQCEQRVGGIAVDVGVRVAAAEVEDAVRGIDRRRGEDRPARRSHEGLPGARAQGCRALAHGVAAPQLAPRTRIERDEAAAEGAAAVLGIGRGDLLERAHRRIQHAGLQHRGADQAHQHVRIERGAPQARAVGRVDGVHEALVVAEPGNGARLVIAGVSGRQLAHDDAGAHQRSGRVTPVGAARVGIQCKHAPAGAAGEHQSTEHGRLAEGGAARVGEGPA